MFKFKSLAKKLMATSLIASTIAVCGAGGYGSAAATKKINTSKAITLKMYLVGDKSADFDKVYAKVNAELKKKINATLNVQFISWAETSTKYSLLFSTGEDFDMIFTASGWEHYEDTAVKKGFYNLTPSFLKTYAPDIMKIMPTEAWNQAKINGNVYMVPNYNKEYKAEMLAVRGDLMAKYGFKNITSQSQLESFFDKVAKNEKTITPLGTQGQALQYAYMLEANGWNVMNGTAQPLFAYQFTNPSNVKVISVAETSQFKKYAEKMKAMQNKNYWSKDALSTKNTRSDDFVAGRAAAMEWNMGSCVSYCEQVNKDHPSWKATVIDVLPNIKKSINPYTNNGIAINARSKNAGRAMMALDQLMTNKTIYDLTHYGIANVNYTPVGAKQYKTTSNSADYAADSNCCWGWTNLNLKRTQYAPKSDLVVAKQNAFTALWDKSHAKIHPLDTFSFNDQNVKSQDAVLNTLTTQYLNPIATGLVDNPDQAVSEFIGKLKAAGIDTVKNEIQNQINTYVK